MLVFAIAETEPFFFIERVCLFVCFPPKIQLQKLICICKMFMLWSTAHFVIEKSGSSICLCTTSWDQCVQLQTCRHLAYPLPCKTFIILFFPYDFPAEPEAPEETPYKEKKLLISINHQISCTYRTQNSYGMLLPAFSTPDSLGLV